MESISLIKDLLPGSDKCGPVVALGTMGLKESCTDAVKKAVDIGCSLIDTGEHYGNLELVGAGLKNSTHKPLIILKLSGMPIGDYENVKTRMKNMLNLLGVEKADVTLMHWPGLCNWDVTDSEPLADPSTFQEKITPWEQFCENVEGAWSNMQKLETDGLTQKIGTSNFYLHHLDELAKFSDKVPFANEIYIDASNQESKFVEEMHTRSIHVLAYRPVIYKPFPDAVKNTAARHNVSEQTQILSWLLKRNIYPLVKCRGDHVVDNFTSPAELKEKLTNDDLTEMATAEVGLKHLPEWFAKIWKFHNETGVSEDDVQMLVGMGVDESQARKCLEDAKGNIDQAMELAFS